MRRRKARYITTLSQKENQRLWKLFNRNTYRRGKGGDDDAGIRNENEDKPNKKR